MNPIQRLEIEESEIHLLTIDEETDEIISEEVLCENVYVSAIRRNIITDAQTAKVVIEQPDGNDATVYCSKEEIYDPSFKRLKKHGLNLIETKGTAHLLLKHIKESVSECVITNVHSVLGFHMCKDKLTFFADKAYPKEIESSYIESSYNESSIYSRSCKPSEWRDGVVKLIQGNPYMQLALSLGAVACTNYYLHNVLNISEVSANTPMFSFIGHTSSGKTTALTLAASMWGSTKMIASGSDTSNSYIAMLSGHNGFPLFIDELTGVISSNRNMTEVLYQMSEGKSKGRCNSRGELIAGNTWQSAICFTSEISILDSCTNHNDGLLVRMLEFEVASWTDSAKQADDIKTFAQNNYGSGWELLVKYLMETDADQIRRLYAKVSDEIDERLSSVQAPNNNGMYKRLGSMLKSVLFSVNAVAAALKTNFESDKICDVLVDSYSRLNDPELSYVGTCYKAIRDFIRQESKTSDKVFYNDQYDTQEQKAGCKSLNSHASRRIDSVAGYSLNEYGFIQVDHLKQMLSKIGYDYKKMCRPLYEKGYLVKTENDRYASDVKIGGVRFVAVCFKMKYDTDSQPQSESIYKPDIDLSDTVVTQHDLN